VLVGVRGSGKRSLGLVAAAALGRRFVTEDHFFQSVTGLTRQDYLKLHGSEEFHKQDVDVTRRMLEENKQRCVIDCGLGSLTSHLQEYLKHYCLTNPVVYLIRDMDHIKSLLNLGERSARLLEAGDPSHRKCSNFEFYNLQDESADTTSEDASADRTSPVYSFKLRQAQEDFSHFIRIITGVKADATPPSPFSLDVPLESRAYTHVLEIPLSQCVEGFDFSTLQAAGDVVEIVVDRWHNSMLKLLSKLVASVRRSISSSVLLSMRLPQTLPDTRLAVLNHALRLGVEYLSINLEVDSDRMKQISAMKGHTRIIGTIRNVTGPLGWTDPALLETVKKAADLGCDYVRVMLPSTSRDDLVTVNWFREAAQSVLPVGLPLIAFSTGQLGRASQALNPLLTSVTHPALQMSKQASNTSSTPTLTSAQALRSLNSIFMLDGLRFCIVGGDVSESLSPAMHNAAYEAVGLQHVYTTKNIGSWDDVESLAMDTHFGGASVVQPYKVKAVEKLASLSPNARAIGAVNTLLPLRVDAHGKLMQLEQQAYHRNRAGSIAGWYGDNTDFIGIKVCLSRSLSPRNVIHPKTTGLVVGAGGMARAAVYAMIQLGCRNVFIYNRTASNARAVANHFNDWSAKRTANANGSSAEIVRVIEKLDEPWPAGNNAPTMVVSCVTHERIEGNVGAEFEMPKQWLESPSGGVIVEMAYYTRETALTKQIKQFRLSTELPWVIVSGVETLIEQAVAQFEIFTGRRAPRAVMLQAVRAEMQTNRQYMMDWGGYST
jgi:shikimate 5-dehydrogenase/shikimate kinase/3-dehydroquinate dehydratase